MSPQDAIKALSENTPVTLSLKYIFLAIAFAVTWYGSGVVAGIEYNKESIVSLQKESNGRFKSTQKLLREGQTAINGLIAQMEFHRILADERHEVAVGTMTQHLIEARTGN